MGNFEAGTYAVAVVFGDGRGVELVQFLLELERPRLLAHLHRRSGRSSKHKSFELSCFLPITLFWFN